jgi:PII-like signaling protein
MRPSNPARRLTIFVNETDRHGHRPLYTELVHRAHAAGLAGATVVRGIEGYGASSHIHTTRILSLSEELPLVVVIVDEASKIERFLPQLGELVADKLVVMEEIRVVEYGRKR